MCYYLGMNIKEKIANDINIKFDCVDFEDLIIESVSPDKGDFCLPCFSLAKSLHKNPMIIAEEIANNIRLSGVIEKVEVLSGYVNFFLKKSTITAQIVENFSVENFKSNQGQGKVVCVDYGSPNLAKYLHIGHLKTLIIGESLCRMFEVFGYTVKRLNFIGDYGTPFGKIIAGMQMWGSIEEVEEKGNDALQDYYVKFNKAEEDDPKLSQLARDIFKRIEEKDPEIYPIYEKIIKIGLDECVKMFDKLGVKFDDYRGEMYYNQFVPKTIKTLSNAGLLVDSQGAKIVDLSAFDMAPAVIVKSDGTSIYASRDLSACFDRQKEYKFDKMIYITDVAQSLHFKQWFKIVELLGCDYANRLEHVPYGRFSLPDGKISSRRGKQAVLADLMEVALNKANDVISGRKFEIEKPEDVAQKVAKAVLNFSVLKVDRAKDCVFDIDKAFLFEGETAPYMQYTYTRLKSILRKYKDEKVEPDFSFVDVDAFELARQVNDFSKTIQTSLDKRDSSLICKKIMDICKTFNKFYTTTKVIDGNPNTTKAKIMLVDMLKQTLEFGFYLICIDPLEEM